MQIKNNVKIHNRFDIEIIDKNTGELKQSLVSYNIVLNQMYTRLCGGLSYFVNIHFGSGAGTLSPSRTTLFTHLGTKAAVDEEIIKAIPLSVWKRKIVLNPEEYVGNTISEVGIAFGSTNTNLVTHSLLKDAEGNTISILKTDVDVITIYATIFVTFDDSNPNLEYIDMPSSNILVNYLIGGGASPTGVFQVLDIKGAVVSLGDTANVSWVSDVPNKKRKTDVSRFATTVGNGNVKVLKFKNVFELLFPDSSVFSGQDYVGVNLGVGDGAIKDFILPSGNVRDSSIVIKKNGVVSGDYTLEEHLLCFTKPIILFKRNGYYSDIAFSKDGSVFVASISSTKTVIGCVLVDGDWISMNDFSIGGSTNISQLSLNDDGTKLFVLSNSIGVYNRVGNSWVYEISLSSNAYGYFCINSAGTDLFGSITNSPFYKHSEIVNGAWENASSIPAIPATSSVCGTPDFSTIVFTLNASPFVLMLKKIGSVYSIVSNPSILPTTNTNLASISDDGVFIVVSQSVAPYFIVYKWDGSVYVKLDNPVVSTIGSTPQSVKMDRLGKYIYVLSNDIVYSYLIVSDILVYESKVTGRRFGKSVNVDENNNLLVSYLPSNIEVLKPIYTKLVKFNTPPLLGDVITVDYTVDGVHKTNQYVIDASFAIQFGEI